MPDLQPGCRWAECLCREIDPADTPCLVCESWLYYYKEMPPSEVNAMYTINNPPPLPEELE